MSMYRSLVLATAVGCLLALPAVSDAQSRGRAVPRGSVRAARPPVSVRPNRPFVYRPGVSARYYYGYPWYVGPSLYGFGGFGYGGYGYGGLGYGYGYGYGYPYSSWYGGYPGYQFYGQPGYYQSYGGVRIAVAQRDAEVYVDGYYAGIVDNFDGNLQQVNLEPGPHHLEVRAAGFESAEFDVNVTPGRTITYRTALRPAGP